MTASCKTGEIALRGVQSSLLRFLSTLNSWRTFPCRSSKRESDFTKDVRTSLKEGRACASPPVNNAKTTTQIKRLFIQTLIPFLTKSSQRKQGIPNLARTPARDAGEALERKLFRAPCLGLQHIALASLKHHACFP